LFREHTHHEFWAQVNTQVVQQFVREELSQRRIKITEILPEDLANKAIEGAFRQRASEILDLLVAQLYEQQEEAVRLVQVDGIRFVTLSKHQVEEQLLKGWGKSKEQVIEELYKVLRSYYPVELAELPGIGDVVTDLLSGEFSDAFNKMKWGGLELKKKVEVEDKIRLKVNTYLEPHFNAIKKDLKDRFLLRNVRKEAIELVKKVFTEPSKASQYWNQLMTEIKKSGTGYFALGALLLILALTCPTLYWSSKKIAKIFIIDYLKEIRELARRLK
jgi:hypothetical protein